jgi:NADPH:quinone reductase-like Zn-dependent oxidoreductase
MATPQADKQAVSKAAGQSLVIEEGPLMAPGPNEILVKVEACGVCFSDVFAQNNVMGGGLYVSSFFTPPAKANTKAYCRILVPSRLAMRLLAE